MVLIQELIVSVVQETKTILNLNPDTLSNTVCLWHFDANKSFPSHFVSSNSCL